MEFDEKNSRIPVLFSTADKWEDFYKKIFSALNNKCSSFLMTYSCKNTHVLLNKDTWAVFIHFLKTQCEDQTVFINLACSSASVNNKLRYGLVHQLTNALRAVHVALKSRKMKTLWDFQKRRYGTAPAVIGQHGSRIITAIPEISGLFLHQQEQDEQEERDYLADNVGADNRDEINGMLLKLEKWLYSGEQMD